MFKKQNNMTVMDFTGIYENEKDPPDSVDSLPHIAN